MSDIAELEFWWLSSHESLKFQYCCPGYQRDLPNDDLPDVIYEEREKIGRLAEWCERHQRENVHRKLKLYAEGSGGCETLEGPVLLDFDNDNEELEEYGRFVSACECTREALNFLRDACRINLTNDCKIFFTGRKGFHIEIQRTAVNSSWLETIGRLGRTHLDTELIQYVQRMVGLDGVNTNRLDKGYTVLDRPKDAKRINGSINAWTHDRRIIRRKMVLIPANRLLAGKSNSLVADLLQKSEAFCL